MPDNSLGSFKPTKGPRGRSFNDGNKFTMIRQGLEGRYNNVIDDDVPYIDQANPHDPFATAQEPIVEDN